jgi:hypothetical protein
MLRFRTFIETIYPKERNNPTAFKTDSITTSNLELHTK